MAMVETLDYRRIETKNDRKKAIALAWNVFLAFEAPEYSKEGVQTFSDFLRDDTSLSALTFYGAFSQDRAVGMIASKDHGSHICLFFVEASFQNHGIGRRLFKMLLFDCQGPSISVNSSPYAEKIYERLGFAKMGEEKITNGIRYIPMCYRVAAK
jgi:GNAT superfamily N-acetyltransferase